MKPLDFAASTVYFRNRFVPFEDAKVSIASSPFLYGLSIYTVFPSTWNAQQGQLYVFRLRDHYQRLLNSAKIMDFHSFSDDWDFERFEDTMLELLRKNDTREDALVRATVFIDELLAGTRIHGLTNSLSAHVYPVGEILARSGIHAGVSSWQRTADNAIPSRAKVNGSYINASLMKNEALQNGYDDAIAIDEHGHVSEGTIANLFIVRGGHLITPDSATDLLEGITRNSIQYMAERLGIPVQERTIDRSELYIADEAFMCGSSARVTPILSIDKRRLGNGHPGPITKQLAGLYDQALAGEAADFQHWLTPVYR